MKQSFVLGIGCLFAGIALLAQLPEVTEEALSELGSTYGTPQMNGFVFIEGRYLPPPYTVTRKGNGIFVNRIQIEQPVSWAFFAAAAEGGGETRKKAIDADGDFEAVAPDAVKPAAPAVPAAAPAAAAAEPAAPKAVKSIDDLFADDAPAAPAKAEGGAQEKAEEKPVAADAAKPEAPAPAEAAPQSAVRRDPEDLKRMKEEARAKLDAIRKGYELALSRGEVFFFSERHSRLNGNYGTARTLLGVLPGAMRNAQSPLDLMQRLNQGGVYFVDLAICSALYKNKMTFPLLDDRLRRIAEVESLDASSREQGQTR